MVRARAQLKLDVRSQKAQGIYHNTSNSLTGRRAKPREAGRAAAGQPRSIMYATTSTRQGQRRERVQHTAHALTRNKACGR
ncbi:hypothetical protein WJX77_011173 [Trebouxia sp. C0004]